MASEVEVMALKHEEVIKSLEALFVGDALVRPLEVREHLRQCARCRAAFDELCEVERALSQSDDPAQDGFESQYSLAVIQAASRAAATASPAAALGGRRWASEGLSSALEALRGRWLAPAALAAALCAAALVALDPVGWRADGVAPEEAFAPRIGAVAEPGGLSRAGVHRAEAFCVKREAAGPRMVGAAGGVLECGLRDELKFGCINAALRGEQPLPHLTLVGVDGRGELRWYRPLEVEAGLASVEVGPSERMRPLGQTIRLEVNHAPGAVTLYGVFSALPLPEAAVIEALGDGPPRFDRVVLRSSQGRAIKLGSPGLGEYVVSTSTLKIMAEGLPSRGEVP